MTNGSYGVWWKIRELNEAIVANRWVMFVDNYKRHRVSRAWERKS